jgi:DNA-binding LacI/PurR family transcriptional regulator
MAIKLIAARSGRCLTPGASGERLMEDNTRLRRIGIREIAEEAGVSKATVSYALNGTGRLDPTTRERVAAIARQLGYQANPNARNLRRKAFGTLSMSISIPSEMSDTLPSMDYFMRVWQGAMSAALERGYMMLLTPFGVTPEMLCNMSVDGGIVVDPLVGDPLVAYLDAHGLPAILIGQDEERSEHKDWIVDSPHGALATTVLEHFHERGARRIGFIQSPHRYAFGMAAREAYLHWIARTGEQPIIVEVGGATTELAGYEAAKQMLESPERPDAIYASLDRLAVGALLAADQHGLSVPKDLLIAAGSDGVTRTSRVPITALDLKPALLGRTAVSMLIDRIEHNIEPRRVIIPGELVMRDSTSGRSSTNKPAP